MPCKTFCIVSETLHPAVSLRMNSCLASEVRTVKSIEECSGYGLPHKRVVWWLIFLREKHLSWFRLLPVRSTLFASRRQQSFFLPHRRLQSRRTIQNAMNNTLCGLFHDYLESDLFEFRWQVSDIITKLNVTTRIRLNSNHFCPSSGLAITPMRKWKNRKIRFFLCGRLNRIEFYQQNEVYCVDLQFDLSHQQRRSNRHRSCLLYFEHHLDSTQTRPSNTCSNPSCIILATLLGCQRVLRTRRKNFRLESV